jgi:myo-inositol 2-dehydrogenase/D-chiro-inositol 1-dehydrogenase
MVAPESARMVMETYTAADLSAERNEPVDLPLSNEALAAIADLREAPNERRHQALEIPPTSS